MRMHLEKIWPMAAFTAIIHFHMADICQTVLDGYTITIKQNVSFRGKMHPEYF